MQRLLLLDSDVLSKKHLANFLRPHLFDVVVAHSGADANFIFQRLKFDIVIAGVELADGSGVEFCSTLQTKYPLKLILFSGHSTNYTENRKGELDLFDSVFSLSVDMNKLLKFLR